MKKIARVLLVTLLFLISCGGSVTEISTSSNDTNVRFLALGDSYTIGESVSENERWPNQLAELLGIEGYKIEVKIIARTGWTTNELWEGIQKDSITPPYDMVSLLIGVNNQYRGYDIEEYRQEFIFLLNKAIEYAGGDKNKVFVVSIPDWGVTPFARGRNVEQIGIEINAFNEVNKYEAQKAGVAYVDVTPISREAVTDSNLIANDGLHPSGKMYAEWAKLALPVALEILK